MVSQAWSSGDCEHGTTAEVDAAVTQSDGDEMFTISITFSV